MKITFLLSWADEMGGTELAVFNQAAQLAPRHDVEILSVFKTRDLPFFELDGRVKARYLVDKCGEYQRPVRSTVLGEEECRALSSLPSRVIHRSWEGAFNRLTDIEMEAVIGKLDSDILISTTPALMVAAARFAPSVVITVHQEHRASQLRGSTGQPLLIHAPEVDAIVTLTERTQEWFAESLGRSAPVLDNIPNVAPQGFRPRSSLATRTMVMAGRVTAEKRMDHAIEAFHQVSGSHPEWQLRIFGEGPERNRLLRRVEELGLHDRVHVPGSVQNMSEEWAKASICLLTSKSEAFPLVLLEAFAAGVPAISYDIVTGPAEIIRHGVDGLLVPAGDIGSLAASMEKLILDDSLRTQMGNEALRGLERFSTERITARWEALFGTLTARRDDPERLRDRAARIARRSAELGAGRFQVAVAPTRLAHSTDAQRELEDKIQGQNPSLVRASGRLAEVRNDLLANDAVIRNLGHVADVLERHGIPYVMLRSKRSQKRIAVPVNRRREVLEAFAADYAGQAVYAELLGPTDDAPGAVLAERLASVGEVKGLRVFRPVISSSRTLRYGPGYGCDLEFWTQDPGGESGGWVTSRGATLVGSSLPSLVPTSTLKIDDRSYSTVGVFSQQLVSDICFPIDAVYTWVDDTDPAWRERLDRARAEHGMLRAAESDASARFRNRDELRYSLRSLAMYAPWIRKIFLVTDDQVPSWLDTACTKVEVISHRDLFADSSALPTFNSHAIESQIHRIPGLAEHFIYLNDDFFLGRPVKPSLFFQSNGVAKYFASPTSIPFGDPTESDEGYFAAAKNIRNLIEKSFGVTVTHGFLHAPYPLRRSVLQEISQKFSAELERTSRTKFRSVTDISLPSSLHHHYGYLTGTSVPSALRCSYVNVGDYEEHLKLTRLLTGRAFDVFCLADSLVAEVPEVEQGRVMRAFLRAYFPVASPFERRGAEG